MEYMWGELIGIGIGIIGAGACIVLGMGIAYWRHEQYDNVPDNSSYSSDSSDDTV